MLGPGTKPTPIFWGHGTRDPVIPHKFASLSVDFLGTLGFKDVEFKSYDVRHASDLREIAHLGEWLRKVIPA